MIKQLIIFSSIILTINACTPQKKLIYFQSGTEGSLPVYTPDVNESFSLKVGPNDILLIDIYSLNPDALPGFTQNLERPIVDNRTAYEKGFVIDNEGNIDLPLIGEVNVAGLTMSAVRDTLTNRFKKFLLEPTVVVKLMSFKLSIIGEVNKPGLYFLNSERVSFTEAIAMAGDLTEFGNREKIKVFRKIDDKTHEIPIDLTTQEVLSASGMLMHPDDVIYVEPLRNKKVRNDSSELRLILAMLTTTVVVLTFVINQSK